ncbi:MAG: PspC domain-containing protein [Ferruginibacter sp.]
MKQVININFQGRVVPIEVTAFDILKQYTESLGRYFANEEGKDEIINDIESRIGELFQERLKDGATCITEDDVNAIIKSMGRPEDFESEDGTAPSTESSKSYSEPFTSAHASARRLYRDENDKVIGGVCSGLANYFNIDVVVVRIIFVVLAVTAGFGLVTYLILWVAVPSTASTMIGSIRKKLYRDTDDKFIGGVCSGLANYFGVNAWIPRVLFILPFLGFLSRSRFDGMDFQHFLRLGFSPGSILIYVILWMVLPEANTTAEKLEMKGEKVDMNSIKNSVMEEMKGVQQRAEKFGKEAKNLAKERGQAFGADVSSVAKRSSRSLGDVIVLLFKVFAYFILGCIAFSFVVALFAIGVFAIGIFPAKDYLLTEGWQTALAWGTLIFFIAVPIVGVITWVIRRLAKIKTNRRFMRLSFSALWVIGWVCFIGLLASVSRDFKASNTLREEEVALSNPGVSRLEITSDSPAKKYYSNRWFRMEPFEGLDEDTAYVRNITVHIIKSPNDSFRVTMMKMVRGNKRHYADTLAALINFNVTQQDSTLLIDKGIAINKTDKFRNQRIVLTVYVPVGKQIRIDRSVGWGHNVNFEGGPWGNNDWNVEFDDVEEGWDEGVDYIMQKDGLFTLDGKPADSYKHPGVRINKKGIRVRDNDDDITIDENGVTVNGNDNYRYDSLNKPTRIDSLRMKLDQEQRRTKDSLQKVKQQIDKQLEKIENKEDGGTAFVNTMPVYNLMLSVY